MNHEIETTIIQPPNKPGFIMSTYINPNMMELQTVHFIEVLNDRLAEKAVKEIWKKHGASILKKVDKKTIGNLTVKKLTTLIAKELKS